MFVGASGARMLSFKVESHDKIRAFTFLGRKFCEGDSFTPFERH